MGPLLPLDRYPLVSTGSFDEARAMLSSIHAPIEAELTDRREAFGWRANRIVVGGLEIMASEYGAGVRAWTERVQNAYSMVITLAGGSRASQHGSTVEGSPGHTAVMMSPEQAAGYAFGTGYRGIQVSAPAKLVETAMAAITGVPSLGKPLRFEVGMDLRVGGGAECARLLAFIVGEAERESSGLAAPVIAERLAEAFVYSLVLGLPHEQSSFVHGPPTAALDLRYVRRAEELIAAAMPRHLSIADLAAHVGVSARTLFAAFRAHRGYSPTAFMRARRMELARLRLVAGTAASVTEVALACGFVHFGRFSTAYRAQFGERPRETLRRHRLVH